MINFKNKEKNNTVRVSSELPVNNDTNIFDKIDSIDSGILGYIRLFAVIIVLLCIIISTYILFKFFGTPACIVFVLFSCGIILYNANDRGENKL
jgi:hypothetical protein